MLLQTTALTTPWLEIPENSFYVYKEKKGAVFNSSLSSEKSDAAYLTEITGALL